MSKILLIFFAIFIAVLSVDQAIKQIFLNGFTWKSSVIDLYLVFNYGVAFSMFSFLGENLKYIQIILIVSLFVLLCKEKDFFQNNVIATGFIFGAGSSNILDRFLHDGVVDYIAWHYKFEFAVFNFADMMINFGVFLIILKIYLNYRKTKQK